MNLKTSERDHTWNSDINYSNFCFFSSVSVEKASFLDPKFEACCFAFPRKYFFVWNLVECFFPFVVAYMWLIKLASFESHVGMRGMLVGRVNPFRILGFARFHILLSGFVLHARLLVHIFFKMKQFMLARSAPRVICGKILPRKENPIIRNWSGHAKSKKKEWTFYFQAIIYSGDFASQPFPGQ